MSSSSVREHPNSELWLALWDVLLASGADPSDYTHETRTRAGRSAGYLEFKRRGTAAEAVASVEQLRADYDEAGEENHQLRQAAQAAVDAYESTESGEHWQTGDRMRDLRAALAPANHNHEGTTMPDPPVQYIGIAYQGELLASEIVATGPDLGAVGREAEKGVDRLNRETTGESEGWTSVVLEVKS